MALVEQRGLVSLDSDSEDLPVSLARSKLKSEVQYVVLSDSSDSEQDDEEDEDEESLHTKLAHATWMRQFQARNSSIRQTPPTQLRYEEAASMNQQHGLISSHPNSMAQATWSNTDVGFNTTSNQKEIENLLLVGTETGNPNNFIQTKETHPRVNVGLPSVDVDSDEYVLSLFNDYYPEYNGRTESPLQRFPEADEPSMRANKNHEDMVALHTSDEALGIVLQVLPDICTEFVNQKYAERRAQSTHVDADALLADILSEKSYPKQKPSKKRKRQDGDTDEEEVEALNTLVSQYQVAAASKALQKQFNSMPANYIASVLKMKKSVYHTIRTLTAVEKSPSTSQSQPFQPLRNKRRGTMDINSITDPALKAQFEAAHKKIAKDEEAVLLQQKRVEEEAKATERAFELQDVSECQCCFDTYPNAKMVVCDSGIPHAFCTDCLSGHIKAQLDLQKHDIKCMDGSNCTASFSRSSKQKALDGAMFERLERLEQQNVLRESGLPLDHCPFCDFAAICPPVEEDRELRCQAPDCGIVSCRLCKQKSHVPLTCREYKREQGFEERHKIEEEMTKAFLRMCPKCKIPIFKEGGCNKITCTRCHSHICDVCGKDITKEGYKHFGQACPQSDESSGTRRAANRVKAAEQAAREEVLAANPDLTAADLEIKAVDDKHSKNSLDIDTQQALQAHQLAVHRQRERVAMRARAAARGALNMGPRVIPAENVYPNRMNLDGPPPTPPTPARLGLPQNIPTYNQFVYPDTAQVPPQYLFHGYTPLPPVAPLLQNRANPIGQPPMGYAPNLYSQAMPLAQFGGMPQNYSPLALSHPYVPSILDPYIARTQHNQVADKTTAQQILAGQTQAFPLAYATRNGPETNHGVERW